MRMSELIAAVGDENLRFQNIIKDATSIEKTKHGTKITFYTDGVQAEELLSGDSNQTKNVGLLLWLPRDQVDAALAAEKARS